MTVPADVTVTAIVTSAVVTSTGEPTSRAQGLPGATGTGGSDWALGVQAARPLPSASESDEHLQREAIDQFARCRVWLSLVGEPTRDSTDANAGVAGGSFSMCQRRNPYTGSHDS
jgi:hypothetical protein